MSEAAPEATPEVAPETAAPEVAPEAPPEPVPVVAQTPSNALVQPETKVEEVVDEVVNIFDAAKRLVELVRQHRTVGDAEVEKAAADVEKALPAAQDAPEA